MKNGIELMQTEIEELFIEGSRPVEAMSTRVLDALLPQGDLADQTNNVAWR
ncbi:MAG: hypothetical protein ABSG57_05325 [Candidatus Bathyarchaeia archaeon]|jgi:hypothetical protein